MSLVNAPFGILPDWHISGQLRPTAYTSYSAADLLIPSGTNVSFYKGQPVFLSRGAGSAVNGVTIPTGAIVLQPVVAATATSQAILGIFAGIEYVDSTGKPWRQNFWPANTALLAGASQTVYVWDDPEIIYRAQFTSAPALAAGSPLTGRQFNFDQTTVANGSALTGLSQATIAPATVAAASQGTFRVIKLWNDVLGLATDAYPIYEVKLANHQFLNPATSL